MAFATEHPIVAHSEYRAVDEVVRAGGRFEVVSPYAPAGDQPAAIDDLERRIQSGERDVVLLGATGTGKSATTAWLIERLQRPTLVMAPNKTLAAQLANELREMLPHNAVEYFVSYYDYYQPEAYIAQTDTYIEKDSSINDDVERLRHSATSSLLSRRDVVVVASVSCIYGLGTPQSYLDRSVELQVGTEVPRDGLLRLLVDVQYTRNDMAFTRGSFRVRGDTVEIIPSYEELAVRIEFFGDEIEALYYLHPLTGDVVRQVDSLRIFPATHYVAGPERMAAAISTIEEELAERLAEFEGQGKLLEAQRLRMRTNYDVEMMRQVGFCSGIENYSRHIDGRGAGTPPATLLDYFPEDFLLVIDESHVTVPQIGGMYEGDMSRKRNLVDYGFRLPSAVDNRPLTWEEFADRIGQTVYLSATPGPYELSQAAGEFVEQVIRPTGLVDPKVVVKPTKGQIDDLIGEIRKRAAADERVLVTTLTKKMAEDLTDYLLEMGIRVRYLHSEVDTLRRVELLRQLRLGDYDVLVGINLLREGLDLPEVSLVSILDADKEGFLRSSRSLIQTIGRAARNVSGEVHMYADKMTDSMNEAIDETERRRAKQVAYNEAHGIDPQPLRKKIADILDQVYREADDTEAVEIGGSGRNSSRGRRAQGEPGRAVSAGIYRGPRHRGHAARRTGRPDQGPDGADDGRRPRSAVRAGRPVPRRNRRPQKGIARDGRCRPEMTGTTSDTGTWRELLSKYLGTSIVLAGGVGALCHQRVSDHQPAAERGRRNRRQPTVCLGDHPVPGRGGGRGNQREHVAATGGCAGVISVRPGRLRHREPGLRGRTEHGRADRRTHAAGSGRRSAGRAGLRAHQRRAAPVAVDPRLGGDLGDVGGGHHGRARDGRALRAVRVVAVGVWRAGDSHRPDRRLGAGGAAGGHRRAGRRRGGDSLAQGADLVPAADRCGGLGRQRRAAPAQPCGDGRTACCRCRIDRDLRRRRLADERSGVAAQRVWPRTAEMDLPDHGGPDGRRHGRHLCAVVRPAVGTPDAGRGGISRSGAGDRVDARRARQRLARRRPGHRAGDRGRPAGNGGGSGPDRGDPAHRRTGRGRRDLGRPACWSAESVSEWPGRIYRCGPWTRSTIRPRAARRPRRSTRSS